jgi:N-terminal acetyltransferase B complex non-catalytic subunit
MAEQAIANRRLKSIYDAIDGGQCKKAIQEADKVLKKHPYLMTAKALKALALIRLDRNAEALPLLDIVETHIVEEEAEDNTIQAIVHCFKEIFAPERIVRIYESLFNRFPQNDTFATQLFLAYVRVRDYKQQQRIAKFLHKEFQKPAYHYWNVMSIYMQACVDKQMGKTLLLPLAEKMIKAYLVTNAFRMDGEIDLYVMVLEDLGKYKEAAEVLNNSLTRENLYSAETMHYRMLALYLKADENVEVVERSLYFLRQDFEDWTLWNYLLNALMALLANGAEDAKQKYLSEVIELSLQIVDRAEVNCIVDKRRSAYLARLSLIASLLDEKIMTESELESHPLKSLLEVLKRYVTFAVAKPICLSDILRYAERLSADEQKQFVAFLLETVEKQQDISEAAHLSAVIFYERMRLAFGLLDELPVTAKRSLAAELFGRIVADKSRSPDFVTNFSAVVTNLLWSVYEETQDWSVICELACILEYVEEYYPGNPTLRLVLTRIYGLLGCLNRVLDLCRLLDIKYIQRDTLAHVLFPLTEQYGRYKTAICNYTTMTATTDQNERDTQECLVQAYKNGGFPQVPKIVEFGERCSNSAYAIAADVNNRFLSASFAVENLENVVDTLCGDADGIAWEKLVDNRDFSILYNLMPTGVASEEIKTATLEEIVDYSKLRDLLCQTVGVIGRENVSKGMFEEKNSLLRTHVQHCKEKYSKATYNTKSLQAYTPLYLDEYVRNDHFTLIFWLLDLCSTLFTLKESKNDQITEQEIMQGLPTADDLETQTIGVSNLKVSHEEPFHTHTLLRQCSESLKTLMFSLVFLKLLETLINKTFGNVIRGTTAKPKKLKAGKELIERFDQYRLAVIMAMEKIQQVLMDEMTCSSDLRFMPQLDIPQQTMNGEFNRFVDSFKNALRDCYADSISDMLATIRREDHYFENLKFAQLSLASPS